MVKLFLKNSNLCDHNSPTSQKDRRTDGQTTCDRNTALCTKVHRAVKTFQIDDIYLGSRWRWAGYSCTIIVNVLVSSYFGLLFVTERTDYLHYDELLLLFLLRKKIDNFVVVCYRTVRAKSNPDRPEINASK